jgi:hypothetical protein
MKEKVKPNTSYKLVKLLIAVPASLNNKTIVQLLDEALHGIRYDHKPVVVEWQYPELDLAGDFDVVTTDDNPDAEELFNL